MKTKVALATTAAVIGLCLAADTSSYRYETTPVVQVGYVLGTVTAPWVAPPRLRRTYVKVVTELGRAVGQVVGSFFGSTKGGELGAA